MAFWPPIAGKGIEALPPVNDQEDAATALQLANSIISANPDLAGAYGVYAYNGPTWATALKEAKAAGRIKVVCFDVTTDTINGIKEGIIDATVAQREYDMGYKSVQLIKLMAEKGVASALDEMGARARHHQHRCGCRDSGEPEGVRRRAGRSGHPTRVDGPRLDCAADRTVGQ